MLVKIQSPIQSILMNLLLRNFVLIFRWPIFVLILHVLATITGFYWTVPWLDTPMHFIGGMSIALAGYDFLKIAGTQEWVTISKPFITILFLIALTALAATLWEFFEFFVDYLWDMHMQTSIADTMKDLAMGLSGAAISGLLIKKKDSWR